jgi:hypothetical protein
MARSFLLQTNSVVSVVIASVLLTLSLSLSGCGQVIDRIQGNDKKESSASTENPVVAQPAAPLPATLLPATPSPVAPSVPKTVPLPVPMPLPTQTPTKAQAENFNTSSSPLELHPPQQGTSGASKIYRSSDARRP